MTHQNKGENMNCKRLLFAMIVVLLPAAAVSAQTST
jgi:hypothetical protein